MTSYDSDEDEGNMLLAAYQEHETVATLPVQSTQFHQQTHPAPLTYKTQPTQPLRISSPSQVQVLASSPRRSPTPRQAPRQIHDSTTASSRTQEPSSPSLRRPQWLSGPPIARPALNGMSLGQSMAPPGTSFRSPFVQAAIQRPRSQTVECNFSDEDGDERIRDSDEEKSRDGGNISLARAKFVRNGVPINQTDDQQASLAKFSYTGPVSIPKRSADAMANAYGDSRPRKLPRQAGGPKTQATPTEEKPMALDDIQDFNVRKNVVKMQDVFPSCTVRLCYRALVAHHFHYEDALESLAIEVEREETKTSQHKGSVDLTASDDELQAPTATQPLYTVKRSVTGSKSIQQKWGGQQVRNEAPKPIRSEVQRPTMLGKAVQTWNEAQPSQDAPQKKKKLVRPKRQASPPMPSSPIQAVKKTDSSFDASLNEYRPRNKDVIEVSSDDENAKEVEQPRTSASEEQLLRFLNNCSMDELAEVSAQSREIVEQVLSKRPFEDLDTVRAIVVEQDSTTKTGKARISKRKIGYRLVEVCLDSFESFRIVDELVAECEALGRPIKEEMKRWGFNVHGQGELELTDFDHDSGIGTPTSSTSGDREDRLSKKQAQRLGQPEMMSQDLTMKDYQITGLNWLTLLYSQGMSGILADDMGLGKTCQVISFLAHLCESGKSTGPHLIVVPGSTLENWLREFSTFCPGLRCEPYYGSQKERPDLQLSLLSERDEVNVIVTTYEMATGDRHDTKFLRQLNPVVCVYDEGHALKNSLSKRYQALMRIPAQCRLLLTGTPLQNNLQELISLLAFIMPGVFQVHDEDLSLLFKHKAKTTDDSGRAALLSKQRIDRARAMMTPFILRRKKAQVLKHLPQKISRVEYCDLTPAQASMYAEQTAGLRKAFQGGSADLKLKNNIMMELRKAAIHPLLFRRHFTEDTLREMAKAYMQIADDGGKVEEIVMEDLRAMTDFELNRMCDQEQYRHKMAKFKFAEKEYLDSGKTARLVELLHEHKRNGDRTLVFSQFTMVMDVLEKVFELEDIQYSRIDGSTKMAERQDLIDQYHDDEDILVFMLSTKSGGAGINLTAANKVIIFDQDFNPQTSLQAENRAHRVGQTREVEVVRLITKGTIEEQIQALGNTKLALDERVAGEGEPDPKKTQAVESEGLKMVERMLAESMEGKQGEEGKVDLKDEFMEGLKQAGLKVSGT